MTSNWKNLDSPPALAGLFAQAAVRRNITGSELPDLGLRCWMSVDQGQLERYRKVCGFTNNSLLPPTYLHIVAFPLQMQLLTHKDFPFPLLGLIHLTNRISITRPLGGVGKVKVSVEVADLKPHAKGATFSLITHVEDALGLLWQEDSTMLCKNAHVEGQPEGDFEPAPLALSELTRWFAPVDIGRQYARASGDFNPIHLSALSAKLFGFPQAIAHGLWIKARSLAALSSHLAASNIVIAVQFQKPVRLPSEVVLWASAAGSSGQFKLEGKQGIVHMLGSWAPGD